MTRPSLNTCSSSSSNSNSNSNNTILIKIITIVIIIALVYLILYRKFNESFYDAISTQLLSEIALTLGISVRRIQNLTYTGDLDSRILSVGFTILDNNVIEMSNGEPNSQTVANNAMNLFNTNNFIVTINGVKVRLTRINTSSESNTIGSNLPNQPLSNYASYFNNKGLLDISNYARNKYDKVNTDSSLTNFFKLKIDNTNDYKIVPVLE
jgi:hypothetical protein